MILSSINTTETPALASRRETAGFYNEGKTIQVNAEEAKKLWSSVALDPEKFAYIANFQELGEIFSRIKFKSLMDHPFLEKSFFFKECLKVIDLKLFLIIEAQKALRNQEEMEQILAADTKLVKSIKKGEKQLARRKALSTELKSQIKKTRCDMEKSVISRNARTAAALWEDSIRECLFADFITLIIEINKAIDMCDISSAPKEIGGSIDVYRPWLSRLPPVLDYFFNLHTKYVNVLFLTGYPIADILDEALIRSRDKCLNGYWDMYAKAQKCVILINQFFSKEFTSLLRPETKRRSLLPNEECPWDLHQSSLFEDSFQDGEKKKTACFLFSLKHKEPPLDIVNGFVLGKGYRSTYKGVFDKADVVESNKCLPAFAYSLENQSVIFPVQIEPRKVSLPSGDGLFFSYSPCAYSDSLWQDLPRKAGGPWPVRMGSSKMLSTELIRVYIKANQTICDGILQHILCKNLEKRWDRLNFLTSLGWDIFNFDKGTIKSFLSDCLNDLVLFFGEVSALRAAGYTMFDSYRSLEDGSAYAGNIEQIREALEKDQLDNAMLEFRDVLQKCAERKNYLKMNIQDMYTCSVRKVVQYYAQEEERAALTLYAPHKGGDYPTTILSMPPNCPLEFQLLIMSATARIREIGNKLFADADSKHPLSYDFYVPSSALYEEIIEIMQDFQSLLESKQLSLSQRQQEILENVRSVLCVCGILAQWDEEEQILPDAVAATHDEMDEIRQESVGESTFPIANVAPEQEILQPADTKRIAQSKSGEIKKLQRKGGILPPVTKAAPLNVLSDDEEAPPASAVSIAQKNREEFLSFCFDRDGLPTPKEILNHRLVRDMSIGITGAAGGGHSKFAGIGHISLPRDMGKKSWITQKRYIYKIIGWVCLQFEQFANEEKERGHRIVEEEKERVRQLNAKKRLHEGPSKGKKRGA